MPDGCNRHGIAGDSVPTRWAGAEKLIEAAPEDDRDAQWKVIGVCICCLGPCKVFPGGTPLCTQCCRG